MAIRSGATVAKGVVSTNLLPEACAACRADYTERAQEQHEGMVMWLCIDFSSCGKRWRKLPR